MTRRILPVLVAALLPAHLAFAQGQEEPSSPRLQAPLTILQMNDVYSTVPRNDRGGLARVATIKRQLSVDGHTTIMMLAGDFPDFAAGETLPVRADAAGAALADDEHVRARRGSSDLAGGPRRRRPA